MKSLKALRDSRKYFLTFAAITLITIMYGRIADTSFSNEDKLDAFKIWAYAVVGIAGLYQGANALQHGLMGPSDNYGENNIIINRSEDEIPDEK